MTKTSTGIEGFFIRTTEREDIPLILSFIWKLAEYEKMTDEVETTESILEDSLFNRKVAEALIAEYQGEAVGFAVFFHNFSTFVGRPGLYLEDLFILPEMRGRGFGKEIFKYLAKAAVDRNCGRMEWSCLDWNTPSICFYKQAMHARAMDEWTVYRLAGQELHGLANQFPKG